MIRGSSEGRGNAPAASASTHVAASPTQIGSIPAVGGANALFHGRPPGGTTIIIDLYWKEMLVLLSQVTGQRRPHWPRPELHRQRVRTRSLNKATATIIHFFAKTNTLKG